MNKIFKNSLFNVLRVVLLTPIAFILPPYTISKIGVSGYGLFALISVVNQYTNFINLGLSTSLVRFIAKAEVKKDYTAISEYLATSLVIYLLLSIAFGVIIFLFRYFIVIKILNINENIEVAVFLISVAVVTIVINMISGLFNSIMVGLQRIDITNIIIFFNSIFSAILVFIVLESGYGIKGLAIRTLILSFISLIVNIIIIKYLIPIKINPFLFRKARFQEMFSYSINLQLSTLIYGWIEPVSKILISNLFSVSYVAYYEIAIKFIKRITILIRQSIDPIFPAASELYEKYGLDKIEKLRKFTSKYLFIIITTLFVVLVITIPDFIHLWLGAEMQIVSPTILILLVGISMSLLATPSWALLNGTGHSRETLFVQIQTVIINVIGIIIFSKLFGFFGFCIGYSLSEIYGFFAIQYYYRKRFGQKLKMYEFFKNKKVILWNIIFFIFGFSFIKIFTINNFLFLGIFLLVFIILYLLVIWKTKMISRKDIKLLFGARTYNKVFVRNK